MDISDKPLCRYLIPLGPSICRRINTVHISILTAVPLPCLLLYVTDIQALCVITSFHLFSPKLRQPPSARGSACRPWCACGPGTQARCGCHGPHPPVVRTRSRDSSPARMSWCGGARWWCWHWRWGHVPPPAPKAPQRLLHSCHLPASFPSASTGAGTITANAKEVRVQEFVQMTC